MNNRDEQVELLIEAIGKHSKRRFFEAAFERFFRIGKVKNATDTACDVDCGNIVITGVKLSVLGDTDALIVKPKINSLVLIEDISGGNQTSYRLVKSFEIDKITLNVDTEIIINGGQNDGLVKIKELTDKLNELKDSVNSLIEKYNAHTHTTTATVDAGSPGVVKAVLSQATDAQSFNKNDYENTKIKH